jgi:hypothetical protein
LALRKQTLLPACHLSHHQVPTHSYRYHWNIFKALEYLNARREGIEID